jgi:hypothetical protein
VRFGNSGGLGARLRRSKALSEHPLAGRFHQTHKLLIRGEPFRRPRQPYQDPAEFHAHARKVDLLSGTLAWYLTPLLVAESAGRPAGAVTPRRCPPASARRTTRILHPRPVLWDLRASCWMDIWPRGAWSLPVPGPTFPPMLRGQPGAFAFQMSTVNCGNFHRDFLRLNRCFLFDMAPPEIRRNQLDRSANSHPESPINARNKRRPLFGTLVG